MALDGLRGGPVHPLLDPVDGRLGIGQLILKVDDLGLDLGHLVLVLKDGFIPVADDAPDSDGGYQEGEGQGAEHNG